jgi:hypothetical protein
VPHAIDFVTARTEFYTRPTALPEVERSSIKLDLHRRDFSVNTLAIRLDGAHLGKLLDFYGGRRDLQQGIIRVLHSLSFIDDPTRILRAIRLEQRLGFTIEPRTAELISDASAPPGSGHRRPHPSRNSTGDARGLTHSRPGAAGGNGRVGPDSPQLSWSPRRRPNASSGYSSSCAIRAGSRRWRPKRQPQPSSPSGSCRCPCRRRR